MSTRRKSSARRGRSRGSLRAGPAAPGAPPGAADAERSVSIANRHPGLRLDRRAVARVIHLLDAHHDRVAGPRTRRFPGELSLVFLTDRALASLHDAFLDDPTTTDVITFEGAPAHGIGGEICVSADTAAAYAREHGREFSDELALYVVHGWLHLAGHDDLQPARKRVMRRAEARAMALLRQQCAMPRMTLARARRRAT